MAAEESLMLRLKADSSNMVSETAKSNKSLQDLQKSYLNFSASLEKIVNPQAIQNFNNHLSKLSDEITSLGGKVPVFNAIDNSVKKVTSSSMQARYAVMDFGHILRDLPYAMSNPNILVGPIDRMTQALTVGSGAGGGLFLAVTAVSAAFSLFGQTLFSASSEADKLDAEVTKATNSTFGEIVTIQSLISVARDETLSRKERTGAIKELQEKYPEYLSNLKLENVNSKEITKSLNDLTNALVQKAVAEVYSKAVAEKYIKTQEDRQALDKKGMQIMEAQAYLEKQRAEGLGAYNRAKDYLAALQTEFYRLSASLDDSSKAYDELFGKLRNTQVLLSDALHFKKNNQDLKDYLRVQKELLLEHLKFLKDAGLARTQIDNPDETPDQYFKDRLPKKADPYDKYLQEQFANQQTQRTGVPQFTGNDDWQKGFQEFLNKAELIQIEGKLIGDTFKSAFQSMFQAINNGKPIMQAFFDGMVKSIEQVIVKLAEAAAISAFLNFIPGMGGLGFLADFKSYLHFSQGGLVPGAGNGDTVPAMLTPGEYVVPKDQVSKVLQLLGASSSNLPIASTAITSGMSGRQFRSGGSNSDSPQIVGVISGSDILLLNTRASSQKKRVS